eukprot:7293514-Ditylum_brightwellii.AAC.1
MEGMSYEGQLLVQVVTRRGCPVLTLSAHAIVKARSSFVCVVESPLGADYTPRMHEAMSDE